MSDSTTKSPDDHTVKTLERSVNRAPLQLIAIVWFGAAFVAAAMCFMMFSGFGFESDRLNAITVLLAMTSPLPVILFGVNVRGKGAIVMAAAVGVLMMIADLIFLPIFMAAMASCFSGSTSAQKLVQTIPFGEGTFVRAFKQSAGPDAGDAYWVERDDEIVPGFFGRKQSLSRGNKAIGVHLNEVDKHYVECVWEFDPKLKLEPKTERFTVN